MIKLGLYKHYKGKEYEVIGVCRHSETHEKLVVYRTLYGEYRLWVRPFEMFTEKIKKDGQIIDRFEFIGSLFEYPPIV